MERLVVIWCPELLEEGSRGEEARRFARVLSRAGELCPWVHSVRLGVGALPARGPARFFGGEEAVVSRLGATVGEEAEATIGVADGLFAAVLAARSELIVPAGGTADFLGPWSVATLARPDLAVTLQRLGVTTLGQFAALPAASISDRFGADAAACHAVARGESGELVGLRDRAKDRTSAFSGGMKRRLNLAAALLHDPQILLLDEPTVGVDPQSRNAIFDNLETLKARGKTLIYTTHYMEEAERLCDRLVVIDHGKVIANDTLHGLYKLLPVTNLLLIELADGDGSFALEQLQTLPEVTSAQLTGRNLKVGVHDLSTGAPRILQWLVDQGHCYQHVVSERPDLETVFLSLTGRSLRD